MALVVSNHKLPAACELGAEPPALRVLTAPKILLSSVRKALKP